jgi:hypothetical protein
MAARGASSPMPAKKGEIQTSKQAHQTLSPKRQHLHSPQQGQHVTFCTIAPFKEVPTCEVDASHLCHIWNPGDVVLNENE